MLNEAPSPKAEHGACFDNSPQCPACRGYQFYAVFQTKDRVPLPHLLIRPFTFPILALHVTWEERTTEIVNEIRAKGWGVTDDDQSVTRPPTPKPKPYTLNRPGLIP